MLRKLSAAVVAASLATAVAVVPAHAGSGAKTVSVKNNSFSPTSVSVKKGGKVTWKWTQGGVPHNVTPAGGAGSATSSKKGFTFSKTFSKAGTFKYHCTIHSSMKMTVKVS
jgi:plastocyanin